MYVQLGSGYFALFQNMSYLLLSNSISCNEFQKRKLNAGKVTVGPPVVATDSLTPSYSPPWSKLTTSSSIFYSLHYRETGLKKASWIEWLRIALKSGFCGDVHESSVSIATGISLNIWTYYRLKGLDTSKLFSVSASIITVFSFEQNDIGEQEVYFTVYFRGDKTV
jgi:hypothetical protein